jgi:hypothetical protein
LGSENVVTVVTVVTILDNTMITFSFFEYCGSSPLVTARHRVVTICLYSLYSFQQLSSKRDESDASDEEIPTQSGGQAAMKMMHVMIGIICDDEGLDLPVQLGHWVDLGSDGEFRDLPQTRPVGQEITLDSTFLGSCIRNVRNEKRFFFGRDRIDLEVLANRLLTARQRGKFTDWYIDWSLTELVEGRTRTLSRTVDDGLIWENEWRDGIVHFTSLEKKALRRRFREKKPTPKKSVQ